MDFIAILVSSSVSAAVVAGCFALGQAIVNKRLRTPADKLASEDFAYKVIKERLEEANADRKVLTDTVNYLRDDARKRDQTDAQDFEREQEREKLIRDLNRRIGQLEMAIQKYESRLERLATKVKAGEPITLRDIYDTDMNSTVGDLEDTIRTQDLP